MVPPPAPGLIERPRLVHALDAGVQRPLTLVSAPAGSGKTALLAQWAAAGGAPGRIARLALARESSDRRGFWAAVLGSLGHECTELSGLAVPPRGALEGVLVKALDALAGLEEPLVLVLEDLHVCRSQEVAADLDWLLDNPPPNLRLLVATRKDPPLRLERLRLAGKMTELRAADLAFTLSETAELLSALGLSDEDVELLWRRTEGWVAGARLAQLSLETSADRHGFVVGFAGDDHAVSDYLLSEVVGRQPPETLDFLLRTCVVDRLNGELADVLTGGHRGDQLLRHLERADGLVTAIDGRGGWYRYHALLVQVLRAEARRRLPGELRLLHRAAGRWHARQRDPLDAVRHALAAADWELAAEMIAEHWLVAVTRGSGAALLELAERMPPEVVRGDAELALGVAGLLLEAGDEGGADELLVEAYRLASELPPERRRRFAVSSTATTLYRARLRGDVDEALSAARLVLDEHWDRDVAVEVRALTFANIGIAEYWTGDVEAAGEHLQQAAGLALECANDFVLFLAASYAAGIDARAGRSSEAWTRAHTAIQLAERRGWTEVAHAAIAYGTLAAVRLWRNELAEAERLTERAADALARSSEPLLGPAIAQLRAQLLMARGDPLTALDVLRGATAHGPLPLFLRVSTGILEAELWLALGEPARARERLSEVDSEPVSDAAIGFARLELAAGDPGAALRAIATFHGDDRDALVPSARVEAWVIDAVARDAVQDERGALRALECALDMAEPRGHWNVIPRYGAPARSLLGRLLVRGTAHRAFAGSLIAVLEKASTSPGAQTALLLDPLSERELTVLRFLPTMMSNAEIASEMFVSVNTVKTHLKHVYRKLDVRDRRECVRRARQLRLLSPGVGRR